MARHLLLSKPLARALPALGRAVQVVEGLMLQALVALLRALPMGAAFGLARGTLRLLGPLTPMWEKVGRNHAIAFPGLAPSERQRLRRETFAFLGESIAELVLAPRIWEESAQRIEWQVDPAVQDLLEAGKPLVMVTGHVGAWQLTNLVSRRWNIGLCSLYAEESNPRLAALLLSLREGLGARWRPSAGGIRTLLEELRAGHSVGLACDTRMDQGEELPFLGQTVLGNTVPARLALRTGCPLVPVLAERLPGRRYRISVQAPVEPDEAGVTDTERARAMSARLMTRFESWVRARPAEWMCLARRFPKALDKSVRGS